MVVADNVTGAVNTYNRSTSAGTEAFSMYDTATGKDLWLWYDGAETFADIFQGITQLSGPTIVGGSAAPGVQSFAKLSATKAVISVGGAGTYIVEVNWTTNVVTVGASNATLNGSGGVAIYPVSATEFVYVYLNSSGQSVGARYCTVSGTTITANAAVTTAATNNNTNAFGVIQLADGKWVEQTHNNTTGTTQNFYGLSLSGSTLTWTAQESETLTSGFTANSQFPIYRKGSCVVIDSDRTLFARTGANGVFVLSFSGGTLTKGASVVTSATTPSLIKDFSTGAQFFAHSASAMYVLSISGTTVTISETVAIGQSLEWALTPNLTSAVYKGTNGTWYTWGSGGLGGLTAFASDLTIAFTTAVRRISI
jgi:hypothetical protein